MTISDCIQDAINDGHIDKKRGEDAQRLWREMADRYEGQGYNQHQAEAMAADDLKEGLKREAGAKRHRYGTGTPFNALVSQMNSMSRRVAEARMLSINGDAGLDAVRQMLAKHARDNDNRAKAPYPCHGSC